MPQITVIVPVYKVEQYLDRCVESILAQTFKDFELILVDDGSPDNCPQMCDEWAKKDARIRVIHQLNGGLSAARNAGIDWAFANSDSEWLTFIDSDDWVHPKMLQCLYGAVVENDVKISICGFYRTEGESPNIDDKQFEEKLWNAEDFYVEHNVNAVVVWGKLYNKACFDKIRYPIGKLYEDEFTTYRIIFEFASIAVVAAPLYMYFQNKNGIMNSEWNIRRLDLLDALCEQSDYFMQKNYLKAHNQSANAYLCRFNQYIIKLKEYNISEKQKKQYLHKYSSQLAKFLKPRKKLYTVATHPWQYEFAFPCRMYIYWTARSIIGKLKGDI